MKNPEKKQRKDFYDEIGCHWIRLPHFYGKDPLSIFWDQREKEILDRYVRIRPGDLVLDVACGPGRWVIEYSRSGAEVVALDISTKMIKAASQKIKNNVEFVVGDAEQLPFREDTFSVVNCFDAFPGFPHPFESLREMKTVMRRSGTLVVEPTNIHSLTGYLVTFVRKMLLLVRKLFNLRYGFGRWYDEWNRFDSAFMFKKWLEDLRLSYKVVGVNILPPPLWGKLITPFFAIENYLEKRFNILNLFGYRLVYIAYEDDKLCARRSFDRERNLRC
jgi:SAM-dependent methyltransferase